MKRKLKALAVITILALSLFAIGIPSYAYAEETDSANDVHASDNGATDAPDAENVFTAVFNEITEYATEIFCAMTFIGSLILAYAYKKGLLPLVEKALISISGSVSKIKEKTESGALAAEELGEQLSGKLEDTEGLITSLAERVAKMNDEMSAIKVCELERADSARELAVIVGTQIDMLYDIFMTSTLPQYQKDAVGERVARMKEALAENGRKE